jgi:CBS domain-containing protein
LFLNWFVAEKAGMPLNTTIRDIYIPLAEYPHIRDTAILRDAYAVLHDAYKTGKRFRRMLVLDAHDQLVGVLGIRDLLRGVFPDYLRTGEHHHFQGAQPDVPALTLIWQETCATQCKEAARKPISGFMGAVPDTVKLSDPITLAAYLMVIHDTSMLPVVDGSKVVGVVRIIDVFNTASTVVLHD